MAIKIFKKKTETTIVEKTTTTIGDPEGNNLKNIAPKKIGMLDMHG